MESKEKPKKGRKKGHYKIYSSKDSEKRTICPGIYHCRFKFEGKFNLLALEELKEQGYLRTYPIQKNIVKDEDFQMITYFKKPRTITLSANKEKNLHEIGVNFYNPTSNLNEIIEIKSNLEEILEKDLEIISPPIKNFINKENNN